MNKAIEISYPHLNGLPVATITLERDIKVDNEPMPDLVVDKFYSAKDAPPQNKRDIKITIEAGRTKSDTIKVYVEPNYTLDGSHFQYIKGVKVEAWKGNKETDERAEAIKKEYTNALTRVYKLATEEDLASLESLVGLALAELDKAERK